MEERGFDVLTKGEGAWLLVASTILLVLIILAGGLFFRYKEMEWRAAHKEDQKNDEQTHRATPS